MNLSCELYKYFLQRDCFSRAKKTLRANPCKSVRTCFSPLLVLVRASRSYPQELLPAVEKISSFRKKNPCKSVESVRIYFSS